MKLSVYVLAFSLMFVSAPVDAQGRRGGAPRSSVPSGRAVPRTGPSGAVPGRGLAPRVIAPYRSYYGYPYSLSFGFFGGYPYGYYGYPYAYGYRYGYGYPAGLGAAYGAVRIQDAPRDAQVYADGYYVGVVDDFDGTFQHLNLTPGAHRIEIREPGAPATAFDVRVEPGQTITYHAK